MNCVQGFDSVLRRVDFGFGMICGSLCAGIVSFLLNLFRRYDKDLCAHLEKTGWQGVVPLCVGLGIFGVCKTGGDVAAFSEYLIMMVYLTVCSITDSCMQQVYDVMQIFGGILVGGLALVMDVQSYIGVELIVFAMLQGLLFLKMYGEADAMAFLICALSLLEGGLLLWLTHMALTFLFLGIIQGIRGNIASDGNLKLPVALYPYIAVAYVFVF